MQMVVGEDKVFEEDNQHCYADTWVYGVAEKKENREPSHHWPARAANSKFSSLIFNLCIKYDFFFGYNSWICLDVDLWFICGFDLGICIMMVVYRLKHIGTELKPVSWLVQEASMLCTT